MVVAAATAAGLLLGVEPLGLGLEGVWGAMALLMLSRLGTLWWRYQDPSGPLPPPSAAPALGPTPGGPAVPGAGAGTSRAPAGSGEQQQQQQQQGGGAGRASEVARRAAAGAAVAAAAPVGQLANNAVARVVPSRRRRPQAAAGSAAAE